MEMKQQLCQSIQKQIKKLMKKLESLIIDFDNVHIVQNELEVFGQTLVKFQDAYSAWSDIISEQENVPVTDWYNEHWLK